jgi:hypothetical protein
VTERITAQPWRWQRRMPPAVVTLAGLAMATRALLTLSLRLSARRALAQSPRFLSAALARTPPGGQWHPGSLILRLARPVHREHVQPGPDRMTVSKRPQASRASAGERRQQRPVARGEPHPASTGLPLQDQELVVHREDLRVLVPAGHRQQPRRREYVRHTGAGQSQHGPSPCRTVPRRTSAPPARCGAHDRPPLHNDSKQHG